MKYTRRCFDPWFYRNIHAGGLICPWCAPHDTDYGDYILDYIDAQEKDGNLFNNESVIRLKRGLLTGNLNPMCQNCELVPRKLISTDEFKKLLECEFQKYGIDYIRCDYSTINELKRVAIGITNRCNLRCIYCNQSVLADTNPYFQADFPEGAMEEALEMLAELGVRIIETGAFGEATLHREWVDVFGRFYRLHPDISLRLVTNLSKTYSQEEIDLLTEHEQLIISIDTLDKEKFERLRPPAKIERVLENIELLVRALDKKGYSHRRITLSAVVSNITWSGLEDLADYAFSHGFNFGANNLELRANSVGAKEHLLDSVDGISESEKIKFREMLVKIAKKAGEAGVLFGSNVWQTDGTQGDYNAFSPEEANPIIEAFVKKYPMGMKNMHLGIVYDKFQIPYEGIMIEEEGISIDIRLSEYIENAIIREIWIYRTDGIEGKLADERVHLDYRKRIGVGDEFVYCPNWRNGADAVLLQILP